MSTIVAIEPLSTEDVNALDPGVRDLVVALRAGGYDTTDSGDGVTKEQVDGCTLPFLHVYIHVSEADRRDLVGYADRLRAWLVSNGRAEFVVEASYATGEPAMCMVRRPFTWADIDVVEPD